MSARERSRPLAFTRQRLHAQPWARTRSPRSSAGSPRAPCTRGAVEALLAETQRSLAAVTAQNERLAQTLRDARDQILTLKDEVDRLAQPPAGFGTFLHRNEDDSIDVFTGGRKLRVNVSPSVDLDELQRGQEVMLNEALQRRRRARLRAGRRGGMLKEFLADGDRVLRDRERRRGARRTHRRAAARGRPCAPVTRCCSTAAPATSTSGSRSRRSGASPTEESPTSTTRTSADSRDRSTRSATRWSFRTSTPTCSPSTSSSRRRACCSTARPAAGRR